MVLQKRRATLFSLPFRRGAILLLVTAMTWACSRGGGENSSLFSFLTGHERSSSHIHSPITTAGDPLFGENQSQGLFRLEMTDFPLNDEDVLSVVVKIRKIQIHPADGEWSTLLDYGPGGKAYDLLTLQNGRTAELGAFNLEPGTYDQIRLILDDSNEIIVKENGSGKGTRSEPLTVPSGVETGIKLVRSFAVERRGVTTLVVDFDAQKSVSYNKGQGYKLKPTLKVIEARTNSSATRLIEAGRGGTAEIAGRVSVEIPAGALTQDTEIAITPLESAGRPPFSSVTLLSSLYELGPDGTQFNSPITLTFSYDPQEAATLGLDESALDLYYFDTRSGEWVSAGGTVDMDRHVVTAAVSHFTPFGVGGAPTDAPRILPAAIVYATDGVNISQVPWKVTATIKDSTPGGISSARLYYKRPADIAYNILPMTNVGGNNYEALFPLAYVRGYVTGDTLEVYILAQDNDTPVRISCAPSTCDVAPHSYPYNPDVDADGMNDRWEVEMGLDITVNDASDDPDGDSFTNLQEYLNDTNPLVSDLINKAPLAKIARPLTSPVNTPLGLTTMIQDLDFVSCGSNPDGYSVQWTLSEVPAGSALLPDAVVTKPFTMESGGSASVYSYFTPDVAGIYQLDLVVTDDPGICAGGAMSFSTSTNIKIVYPWINYVQTPKLDWGRDLLVDGKGNVYATGTTAGDLDGNLNQGLEDIYLVKYDARGQRLWSRTLGTSMNEAMPHILESRNGSIVVGGFSTGNLFGLYYSYFIAYYDVNGNLLWGFNGTVPASGYVYDIAEDSLGNIYVSGNNRYSDHDEQFLAKHDSKGKLLWRRAWTPITYNNKSTQSGAMAVDAFDNIYILEPTLLDATGDINIRILKFDRAGNWSELMSLGSLRKDMVADADVDAAGNLYITGVTIGSFYGGVLSTYPGFPTYNDIFLAKVDPSSASVVWSVQRGTPSVDSAYGVDVDPSGNLVALVGSTQGNYYDQTPWNAGNVDYLLGVYDTASGNERFFVQNGSGVNMPDYGIAVRFAPGLNYLYLMGHTSGDMDGQVNQGYYDAYVVRYNVTNGQRE